MVGAMVGGRVVGVAVGTGDGGAVGPGVGMELGVPVGAPDVGVWVVGAAVQRPQVAGQFCRNVSPNAPTLSQKLLRRHVTALASSHRYSDTGVGAADGSALVGAGLGGSVLHTRSDVNVGGVSISPSSQGPGSTRWQTSSVWRVYSRGYRNSATSSVGHAASVVNRPHAIEKAVSWQSPEGGSTEHSSSGHPSASGWQRPALAMAVASEHTGY